MPTAPALPAPAAGASADLAKPQRPAAATGAAGAAPAAPRRVAAIDILRGAAIVLMALDHVRVYAGVPAGGPDPAVFLTRWVTHFCAPAFVFLAGTSAFLNRQKLGGTSQLARYLLLRGAVLVMLELTVLRLAWTFNFDYTHYVLAGVIWMLGWCMILMAALVWLPPKVNAICGLLVIGGHDLVDAHLAQLGGALRHDSLAWFWQLLYFGGPIELRAGGTHLTVLSVLYSIVPWIGVMAAGYGFGEVLRVDAARRQRWCLAIGGAAIAAFLVLRGLNLYGNPYPWGPPHSRLPPLLSFLNLNKYPASLQFLLMTLGPLIALLALLPQSMPHGDRLPGGRARAAGALARLLAVFGRVPLFFYLLHIPLIHAVALLVSLARSGAVDAWLFQNHPMMPPPPPSGYVWSLPLLYLVWIGVTVALYLPCRWFAEAKRTSKKIWLSYL